MAITPLTRPDWLRVRLPSGENYEDLKQLMRSKALHTVCEEARCPNMGECWGAPHGDLHDPGQRLHAQLRLLRRGHRPPDGRSTGRSRAASPRRSTQMGLKHVVVTSVNRDELRDGGATLFAATIRWIRRLNPDCTVEVLTPDFKGSRDALQDGHGRAARRLQPQRRDRAAPLPAACARRRSTSARWTCCAWPRSMDPETPTKTGFMLGLGETRDEVLDLLRDLRARDVDIVTIGQYLRPTPDHLPIERYVPPDEFREYARDRQGDGLPPRRERPAGAQLLPRLGSG